MDAELFFNDGTSIEGYGELYKTDKIKFRISQFSSPEYEFIDASLFIRLLRTMVFFESGIIYRF